MRLVIALFVACIAGSAVAEDLTVPEGGYAVSEDPAFLPLAVREKHDALLAAARSGDMARLKAIFDGETVAPTVSFGEPGDPIAYLTEQSADGKGLETLATLANILSAPYAALDGGDGELVYVWPYFAAMMDLDGLSPAQLVDGYRLLGYSGFEEQRSIGNWLHWRAFISPLGELQAFVAGD